MPSPEVDEAWTRIGKPTWITISEDEVRSLGRDPSLLVKAPENWGKGSNRYVAMLDIGHQVHCLNVLRQMAYQDYYPLDIPEDRISIATQHWMHCVHILYQNIMCTASTEIITFNWMETQHFPNENFTLNKVCKNGEVLFDYQEREKIEDTDAMRAAMVQPDDAYVAPLPPRLRAFLDGEEDF